MSNATLELWLSKSLSSMNLLKTKRGRLTAFGGLYFTEGLPQGFSGVAMTLEYKRQGMDAAAIGVFAGTILLP